MRSDEDIDRLLARGAMTPVESQQALDGALRAALPRRRWRWTFGVAVPAVMAAALVLLMVLPRGGFTPKGAPATPLLEVSCADGARDRCARGNLLLFHVAAESGGVLAAWAEPVGGGERVWYFPTAGEEWAAVPASSGLRALDKAVRLGAEQPPGVYEIHLVLAARALPREALLTARPDGVLATAGARLEVTP